MWSKYWLVHIFRFVTSFSLLGMAGTCNEVECEVRCECEPGFLRDTKSDKCLKTSDCPTESTCGKNEEFTVCKQACKEPRCGKGNFLTFCLIIYF